MSVIPSGFWSFPLAFAGALLLQPFLFTLLIIIPHLIEWAKERLRNGTHLRAWYIQPFNISVHIIAGLTAYWIHAVLNPNASYISLVSVIATTLAALIYVALNHVLIGMALYFLMPLLGDSSTYVFVAFFALSALYLILWEAGKTKPKQFAWVLRIVGVGAAVVAVMLALPKKIEEQITWKPYSEQTLAEAAKGGKGVIIDTFADWCIPCKELDKLTFTDGAVKKEAERFVTLKLDLTSTDANSEAGRARQRFGIRGVPTVLFLDGTGRELSELRLEGFEKSSAFLARMKQVESSPGAASQTLAKNAADAKVPVADAAPGKSDAVPTVSLNLLSGGSLGFESLRGKVVVVDFWATWCVPCLSEIPTFNQLKKDYQPRGVEVIAIATDEEGAAKVKLRPPSRRSCGGRLRSSTSGAPPPPTPRSAASRSPRARRSCTGTTRPTATRRSLRIPACSTCAAPRIRNSATARVGRISAWAPTSHAARSP
jgi:thiol-disulfide isomerase/thioredoxin